MSGKNSDPEERAALGKHRGDNEDEEDDVDEESLNGEPGQKATSTAAKTSIKIAVPDQNQPSNKISCTKYSVWNFLPFILFKQIQHLEVQICVLLIALQAIPYTSITNGFPFEVYTLSFILFFSLLQSFLEEMARYNLDQYENNSETELLVQSKHKITKWSELYPGQIIKIKDDEKVPADCILLYSECSIKENCYVDSFELSGETNLLLKTRINYPEEIDDTNPIEYLNYYVNSQITYNPPDANLDQFHGQLHLVGDKIPLGPHNLLLRNSVLRKSKSVYAVVIYTGHNTKAMKMQLSLPDKCSTLDPILIRSIFRLFIFSLCLALFAALYHIIWTFIFKDSFSIFLNYSALNLGILFLTRFAAWCQMLV